MTYWRGLLLSAFLASWPVIFLIGLFYFTGSPTQCDVDVCGPPESSWHEYVFFAAALIPPLVGIGLWVQWRIRAQRVKNSQVFVS